ncbi:MAG: hypothetical protein ACO3KD_01455 [Gaiellales bacterium]
MAPVRAALWVAGAVLVDVLLRLRFLDVPLNVDEAGYGQVARLWSRGFALYGDVAWVDRPQGLVGLYRLAVTYGDDAAIRLLAVAAGATLVVALAVIAGTLLGARAGIIAAWLIALVGPAPHIEGFTANGELLGGAVAAAAIACAVRWAVAPRLWLLVLAGVLAGLGPLVKQSAFDGCVVAAVLVVAVAWRERAVLRGLGRLAVLVAGIALPWAGAALWAASEPSGVDGWWYAIYGYRAGTESVLSGDVGLRVELFGNSIPWMLVDAGVMLVLAGIGLVALARDRRLAIPLIWLLACAAGFAAGGLYHPHYWVQLLPPFALLAAAGVDRLWATRGRRTALVVAAAAALVPVALALPVYLASTPELASARSTNDPRVISAIPVGRAGSAATAPDDSVQVLWANAAVYWHADRIPATRYLWYRNIEFIPGAREDVARDFEGDSPPAAAIGYQPVRALDTDGRVEAALDLRYERREVDGVPVWILARP